MRYFECELTWRGGHHGDTLHTSVGQFSPVLKQENDLRVRIEETGGDICVLVKINIKSPEVGLHIKKIYERCIE